MLTKSPAARTALVYVTVGAMVLVWTTVWYIFMRNHPPEGTGPYYMVGGLIATGATLLAIGLGVGRLGSSARSADNPTIVMSPTPAPPTTTAVLEAAPAPPGSVVVTAAAPKTVVTPSRVSPPTAAAGLR